MKLMTKELEKRFATVGSQKNVKDPIVIARFFNLAVEGPGLPPSTTQIISPFMAMAPLIVIIIKNGVISH